MLPQLFVNYKVGFKNRGHCSGTVKLWENLYSDTAIAECCEMIMWQCCWTMSAGKSTYVGRGPFVYISLVTKVDSWTWKGASLNLEHFWGAVLCFRVATITSHWYFPWFVYVIFLHNASNRTQCEYHCQKGKKGGLYRAYQVFNSQFTFSCLAANNSHECFLKPLTLFQLTDLLLFSRPHKASDVWFVAFLGVFPLIFCMYQYMADFLTPNYAKD